MAHPHSSPATSDTEPQPPDHMSDVPALSSADVPAAAQQQETRRLQTLPAMQEQVLQYTQERLQTLQLQVMLEQQRQRDRLEEELEKLRQLLAETTQEQRHQQHAMAVRLNETLDVLRKEVSDALQRLSQDVDRALRYSEVQTQSTLDKLRHELPHIVAERGSAPEPQRFLGELLIKLGKQLQDTPGPRER